jgi:outer membrane protein OmpA-like peptidoglycan-associated protein
VTGAEVPAPDELAKHLQGNVIPDRVELPNVNFEVATANFVDSGDAHATIDRIFVWMKSAPSAHVRIEGYPDSTATNAANGRLATLRAEKVKQMLVARGIDGGRIEAHGVAIAKPDRRPRRQESPRADLVILQR